MAQINLGRIGIVPKGEWNNIFTYNRLDLVAYAGGGYVSLVDNNNNKLPTDTAYWLQISEKGETGNIDNLEDWHIVDALGYTPANKSVVDAHLADSVTDTDGVHGLKIGSGLWTPTVIDSNGGEATYDLQVGSYKIIGPLVYAQFSVGMASKGTIANGNIYIGGLPAVAVSENGFDVGVANIDGDAGIIFLSNVVKIGSEVRRNTNYIVLRFQKGNGESQLYVTGSDISATARFRGSIIYRRS